MLLELPAALLEIAHLSAGAGDDETPLGACEPDPVPLRGDSKNRVPSRPGCTAPAGCPPAGASPGFRHKTTWPGPGCRTEARPHTGHQIAPLSPLARWRPAHHAGTFSRTTPVPVTAHRRAGVSLPATTINPFGSAAGHAPATGQAPGTFCYARFQPRLDLAPCRCRTAATCVPACASASHRAWPAPGRGMGHRSVPSQAPRLCLRAGGMG
jgi:hypothetical protein